jgi:hypothetical protein
MVVSEWEIVRNFPLGADSLIKSQDLTFPTTGAGIFGSKTTLTQQNIFKKARLVDPRRSKEAPILPSTNRLAEPGCHQQQ